MPHAAVFAVLIGLGVAALLYYVLDDEAQERPQMNRNDSGGSRSNYNDSSQHSESSSTSRRRRSSAVRSRRCDDCSICLNDLDGYPMVCLRPCRHYFHKICINEWLLQSSAVGSCPNCREVIQEKDQIFI